LDNAARAASFPEIAYNRPILRTRKFLGPILAGLTALNCGRGEYRSAEQIIVIWNPNDNDGRFWRMFSPIFAHGELCGECADPMRVSTVSGALQTVAEPSTSILMLAAWDMLGNHQSQLFGDSRSTITMTVPMTSGLLVPRFSIVSKMTSRLALPLLQFKSQAEFHQSSHYQPHNH
jgi:hypothetical protein